ncbi:MAG: tetratricopeptide repeat protein [candidate division Zixibacteria bacterium]|nr:tetratricopeptide repeat protein [candidate division Zixibacteria bacterium]
MRTRKRTTSLITVSRNAPDTMQSTDTGIQRALSALAVALWIGLLLVAEQFPETRLWSINHLAFLPDAMRWGVIGAGALAIAFILSGRTKLQSGQSAWMDRWPGALVLIGLIVGIGWVLRAQTPLLGDGILRGADALVDEAPLGSELLASALAQGMIQVGLYSGSTGGYGALSLISFISAGVLALGLWYYAPRAGIARPGAFVFWILTFGSFRLLAGYVESYAPAFAMLVLWGVASVGFMRGQLSAWPTITFCCVALLSHAATLGVVPATLWMLWKGRQDGHSGTTALVSFPVLIVALTAFIAWEINRQQVGGIGVEAGHFIMPLLPGADNPYSILSLPHIIDFLNQWLLLVPAVIVAAAIVLITRTRPQPYPDDSSSAQRAIRIFWILAIVPMLLGAFLIDPKLGWARDWDLMTIFATPALVALALWLAQIRSASIRRAAGAVAVISLGLWLAVGARAESEEQRFEALLELDPSRAAYGHEILAIYHRVNGRRFGEIKHFKAALEYSDNLRYMANIANAYYKIDRIDDAIDWYQRIYRRDSTYDVARYSLSLTLMRQQRYEEALPHAQWSLANDPDDPVRSFVLGSILLYLQRPLNALPHLEKAAKAMPSKSNYLNILGGCYLRLGRKREAQTVWRRAVNANPTDPSPYVNLAGVEFDLGNYGRARQLLDQYATLVPPSQWSAVPRELHDTLQRIDE